MVLYYCYYCCGANNSETIRELAIYLMIKNSLGAVNVCQVKLNFSSIHFIDHLCAVKVILIMYESRFGHRFNA